MSSMPKKILLIVAVLLLAGAFFGFDLGRYFTLDTIKAEQETLIAWYRAHTVLTLAVYMALYTLVTALSLPVASALSIGGAAVFGFWPALLAVSFSSSIGATLACAAARFVLREPVRRRFGDRLESINRGVEREGAFYLFTLRLIPVLPFFVINLAMGLSTMRLRTFYWVSQLGMLPGTAVYVNAGTQLGQIDSLSGIFSPWLLLSFALLGLFPLLAKRAVAYARKRLHPR